MADISLKLNHQFGLEEAKKRIEEALEKTAPKFGLKTNWEGDTCKVSGPVSGSVCVTDKTVEVDVKLGFAMGLMKGKIEDAIKTNFKNVLG